MRISNTTPKTMRRHTIVLLASIGLTSLAAQAAITDTLDDESYEWSAVLMSFDEDTGTAVLQARIESYVQIEGLDDFADGDRLTLVWTGRTWAAGVRDLAEDPDLWPAALTLPVEFVATARDEQYVNFRIRVPDDAVDTIAAMEDGSRVTGYSPRGQKSWETAVVSLRHYNDID